MDKRCESAPHERKYKNMKRYTASLIIDIKCDIFTFHNGKIKRLIKWSNVEREKNWYSPQLPEPAGASVILGRASPPKQ